MMVPRDRDVGLAEIDADAYATLGTEELVLDFAVESVGRAAGARVVVPFHVCVRGV